MEAALGPRRSRLRNVFMVAQIAGSTLFLTTALLFVRSFWMQASTNPGFETAHLLVLELKPSDFGYDAVRSRALFENLVERVRTLPGVERVALGDRVPFYVGFPKTTRLSANGTDCAAVECQDVFVYGVGAGYMAALGVPIVAGQEFTAQDITSGGSVVVSQKLAARLWPGREAVGQWLREGQAGRQLRVIGVAADVKHHALGKTPREYLYRPLIEREYADAVTGENETRLATAFFTLKNYAKAAESAKRAATEGNSRRPDDAAMLLGVSLVNQKKMADAKKAFATAATDNGGKSKYIANLWASTAG